MYQGHIYFCRYKTIMYNKRKIIINCPITTNIFAYLFTPIRCFRWRVRVKRIQRNDPFHVLYARIKETHLIISYSEDKVRFVEETFKKGKIYAFTFTIAIIEGDFPMKRVGDVCLIIGEILFEE